MEGRGLVKIWFAVVLIAMERALGQRDAYFPK